MDSTQYVVGFMFRRNDTEVALIRKEKPEWQKGRLNGVGGKVEADETSLRAMEREFYEETGWQGDIQWNWFLNLVYPTAMIHFFVCSKGDDVVLTNVTDEQVAWFNVDEALDLIGLLPNLRWLIPLALDKTSPVGSLHGR